MTAALVGAEVLVVVVHYGFLALVVGGGFLALRARHGYRWVLPAHLGAVGWGVLSVAFGWECPLTALQFALRDAAGRPPLAAGFNDTYVFGVIVPDDPVAVQVVVAVVVLASWALLVGDARRRVSPRRHGPHPVSARHGARG